MGKEIEVAIVFADVVGSTKLYELLGDLRARDMVGICIDVMRAATDQNHGTVIKTMGDEVMATFPTADDALNAAAQMQKQIVLHPSLKVDEQTVAIRIGCNFGPVVLENRDIFGSAVHTANRMTSQAKAGQIITSGATVEALSPLLREATRDLDAMSVKGKQDEIRIFEVIWHDSPDLTAMAARKSEASTHEPTLTLTYGAMTLALGVARQSASLGRDAALHVARRLHRGVGRRQYRHQFVADGLDDAAALNCDRFSQLGEHLVDRGERALIAELFIQAGTAAHVGKQDRAMRGYGCHSDRL